MAVVITVYRLTMAEFSARCLCLPVYCQIQVCVSGSSQSKLSDSVYLSLIDDKLCLIYLSLIGDKLCLVYLPLSDAKLCLVYLPIIDKLCLVYLSLIDDKLCLVYLPLIDA